MSSRVKLLSAVVAVAAGLAMLAAAPGIAAATGASTADDSRGASAYQQDPLHDGDATDPGFVAPLSETWSATLTGTIGYPLVEDGRVFVDVGNRGYGTNVEAFSLASGARLWGPTSIGGAYSFGALAYDQGTVFALNHDGVLTALDAESGTQNWTVQLPGQYSFSSPPTAVDGTVYTAGAGDGGTLYAVDESDGSVTWTAAVANGDDSSPVVDATGVYVSYACEQTYKFALDGTPLWHHSTACEGGGGRTAVLHDNNLYVRDDAGFAPTVLDAATGELTGTYEAQYAPAFDGQRMVTANGGQLTATDLNNGQQLWQSSATDYVTAPLIADGYVVAGHSDGRVDLLDDRDGSLIWQGSVGATIPAPDEHNASALTGLAEGDGDLVVPAGDTLTVFAPIGDATASITAGPSSGSVVGAHTTFSFTSSTPHPRYVCTLDGVSSPCTSPVTYTALGSARHTFAVSLAYADDLATRSFTSDSTPPAVTLAPFSHRTIHTTSATAHWSATDSPGGVSSYAVRTRYGITGRNASYGTVHATTHTNSTYQIAAKHTLCIQVRATDRVGNTSAWTPTQCVSRTS